MQPVTSNKFTLFGNKILDERNQTIFFVKNRWTKFEVTPADGSQSGLSIKTNGLFFNRSYSISDTHGIIGKIEISWLTWIVLSESEKQIGKAVYEWRKGIKWWNIFFPKVYIYLDNNQVGICENKTSPSGEKYVMDLDQDKCQQLNQQIIIGLLIALSSSWPD